MMATMILYIFLHHALPDCFYIQMEFLFEYKTKDPGLAMQDYTISTPPLPMFYQRDLALVNTRYKQLLNQLQSHAVTKTTPVFVPS